MAVEGINNNHHHQNMNQTDEMMGDGMQCSEHPYRSNPGGICALCLQEKLGKLVSSSFNRTKSTAGGGFWSFLHLYYSSEKVGSKAAAKAKGRERPSEENDEDDVSFERKVSRSRSVGCGSRSFSGDFFERISTGFGDCTLRRVESQREGKTAKNHNRHRTHAREDHCMKERVRCGGIFGGFILTSSSSSSSSSEWEANAPKNGPGPLVHNRTRSWGWAFASPIRAFSKPAGPTNGKRDVIRQASDKSASTSATTPNLAAIPSLLSVRG